MSFILDALKKIEQDKRRGDDGPRESIAVSRSRFGGRQSILAMVAIAVGSAILTAAAVSFLSRPAELDARSPEVAEPAAPQATPIATPSEEPPAPAPAVAPPAVREAALRSAPEPVEPEPAELEPAASDVVEASSPEVSDEAIDDAPSQEIRIVGRERVLLDGLNIDGPAESDEEDAEPEDDAPLPEDFPNLVLQGTSVIGDAAVAVISDQRVFEGDRVEGALVLRIGEREVELEIDGRRFTLRL